MLLCSVPVSGITSRDISRRPNGWLLNKGAQLARFVFEQMIDADGATCAPGTRLASDTSSTMRALGARADFWEIIEPNELSDLDNDFHVFADDSTMEYLGETFGANVLSSDTIDDQQQREEVIWDIVHEFSVSLSSDKKFASFMSNRRNVIALLTSTAIRALRPETLLKSLTMQPFDAQAGGGLTTSYIYRNIILLTLCLAVRMPLTLCPVVEIWTIQAHSPHEYAKKLDERLADASASDRQITYAVVRNDPMFWQLLTTADVGDDQYFSSASLIKLAIEAAIVDDAYELRTLLKLGSRRHMMGF